MSLPTSKIVCLLRNFAAKNNVTLSRAIEFYEVKFAVAIKSKCLLTKLNNKLLFKYQQNSKYRILFQHSFPINVIYIAKLRIRTVGF